MSEPVVTTQDYVRATIAGDAVKAKEIFNQLMAPVVIDAIDAKRNEVAQTYFGGQPEVEPAAGEVSDEQDANQQEEEADENA